MRAFQGLDAVLLVALAASALIALTRSRELTVVVSAHARESGSRSGSASPSDPTAPRRPAATATRSPFRLSNLPPARRYGERPQLLRVEVAVPPAQPTFALTLKAVVGGPPWLAVVTGLPGTEGERVIRPGDRFDELLVGAIGHDVVLFSTADSSWRLTLAPRAP